MASVLLVQPDSMSIIPIRRAAFTLVEMLVVIGIIGLLAALLLPALLQGKKRAVQTLCESNLRQIGIGFHDFAHDHNGKFPMGVSTNDGGAMEFVQDGYAAGNTFYFGFHVLQTLSNELTTPQLLICPADTRVAAANFAALLNQNVSYFVGVNADFLNVNSVLAGDRNLATNSYLNPTILQLGNGGYLRWTRELHEFKGNILFADSHVEEWNDMKLQSAADSWPVTGDLFLPSVSTTNAATFASSVGNSGSGSSFNAGNSVNIPNFSSTSSSASTRSGGQPGQSPENSFGNNNGLTRQFSSRGGSENLQFTNQRTFPTPTVQGNATNAADDSDPAMSPFDRKVARVLRGSFEWGYFLLLLLLLAYLAYKLWQILRPDQNRRRKNNIRQE